jgi:hypothetical protein
MGPEVRMVWVTAPSAIDCTITPRGPEWHVKAGISVGSEAAFVCLIVIESNDSGSYAQKRTLKIQL